jgi:hypothetical protein
MNNSAMQTLANQVPTSMEELSALGSLGENVVKVYGEKLVECINSFVHQQNLHEYVNKRATKRKKSDRESSSSCKSYQSPLLDLTNDEYGFGTDLSGVEIP